jgi:hypothetical protein
MMSTTKPTRAEDMESEEDVCSICFDDIDCDPVGVVSFHCGHKFHAKCACDWMMRGHTACPNCRQFHPDHKFVAPNHSQPNQVAAREDEGEFSDSASEGLPPIDQFELDCIIQARKDKRKDEVVSRLYSSLMESRRALSLHRKEHERSFKEFKRRRKTLKRKHDQMFLEAVKKLKKSSVGKNLTASGRRYSACFRKEKASLVGICRHYHRNGTVPFSGSEP